MASVKTKMVESKSRVRSKASSGVVKLHRSTLLRVQSKWWDWNYLAVVIFLAVSFLTSFGDTARTYAGGSNSFVRSISKNITPDVGAPFTIGNIDSMVTDYEGNLYVGSGTTIYKFLNNGSYVKQWQTNGQIGKLSFNIYKDLLYKTGDNGVQIFTADGVVSGTLPVNGALIPIVQPGTGLAYEWYGIGDGGGVLTDIKNGAGTYFYTYDGSGQLVAQNDISSNWPNGVQNLSSDFVYGQIFASYDKVGSYLSSSSWSGDTQTIPYSVSSVKGTVYVSDAQNNVVRKLDSDFEPLMEWGGAGSGDLEFDSPGEITASYKGDIFIDDVGNGVIKQYKDTLSVKITNLGDGPFAGGIPEYIRPNTYFSYTFETDKEVGDTVEFELTDGSGNTYNLPNGLNFNSSTGEIYGTIDNSIDLTGFNSYFDVKVKSSNGSLNKAQVGLKGAELSEPIDITTTSLPNLDFGQSVGSDSNDFIINITGGQERAAYPVRYSVSSGSLPAGLRLDEEGYGYAYGGPSVNSSRLVGTANAAGTYNFTVRAESTDPLMPGYDEQSYTITVAPPPASEPFEPTSLNSKIVEVERVEKDGNLVKVYGDGPSNQPIKVSMDGQYVGTAQSTEDGSWQLSLSGVNAVSHIFSASWEPSEDVMFSLGSDLSYMNTPLTPVTTIRVMSMASGKVLKDISLPEGFFPLDVTPSASGSKVYVAGVGLVDGQVFSRHSSCILEYDVNSGSFINLASVESAYGVLTLRANHDGSLLYALASSGVYEINTSTGSKTFISGIDTTNFHYGMRMELNEMEDKIVISDVDGYEASKSLKQDVIIVDLVNKVTSVQNLSAGVNNNSYSYYYLRPELIPRANGFVVAYGDGTVVTIDDNGNPAGYFDFNLDKIVEDDLYKKSGSDEVALMYQYDSNTDSLYAFVYSDTQVGVNEDDRFYLRKLNLQTGLVESSYQLYILEDVTKIAGDPHMVITKDGQNVYVSFLFMTSSVQPGVISSYMYKVDLNNGNAELISRQDNSSADAQWLVNTFPFFYPNSDSVVSNFRVSSGSFVVDVGALPDTPTNPEDPDTPIPVTNDVDDPDKPIEPDEQASGSISSEQPLSESTNLEPRENGSIQKKNIPLLRSLVEKLASTLGVAPITVVRIFPWLFIIFLLIMAGVAILNLIKQLLIVAKTRKLVRRQELLNLEKTWLLSLSSHYLRTPLTIIKAGQELIPEGFYKDTVISGMSGLSKTVSGAIDGLRNDQIVAEVQAPEPLLYKHASLWQPKVVVPALLSLGLVLLVNIVFIVGAKLNPGLVNMFMQVCVVAILGGVLYLAYDTRLEKKQLEAYQKQLLVYEEGLDRARNSFVRSIAEELMPQITLAREFVPEKASDVAKGNIVKGLDQLEATTDKFLLICQLEKEELKRQAAEFGLKDTVEDAKAQSKHPNLPLNLRLSEASRLSQPEVLLKKVFKSLIDNAAEHSDSEKATEVYSKEGDDLVRVSVEDFGKGIQTDKLGLLFKPMSKVEEDFASQGMGLSLYLNRLIMHYLGGEIRAVSEVGMGTTMTVEVPRELA